MWKELCLVFVAFITIAEGCIYKTRECPDYTVVEQHPDYEIRNYPALTWVSTGEISRVRRVGQYLTFMRLFRYISGNNDRGQKMNMTVPVRMQTTRSENGSLYTMDFMVPSEFAVDPPVPADENIKVMKEKATLYVVRTFKGYIFRQGRWAEEARKLADSVKDDETVEKSSYYMVGYDAPFDFFDRRNEIWMVKNSNEVANEV